VTALRSLQHFRGGKGPAYKWWLVALLVGVGAFNYCDRAAIASVLPLLRADLKMSDVELAGIGSCFLWAYGLASPLGGLLADRNSRSRLIVITLVAGSLLTLATGLVTSAHQLLVVRTLLGLVEAFYIPAAVALIADYHFSNTRAKAIGFHNAGLVLGLIVGGAAAGFVGNHYGWRIGFISLGVSGMLFAVVAQVGLCDRTPPAGRLPGTPRPPILAGLAVVLRSPSSLLIILGGVMTSIGNNIFMSWFPLYFTETYRMGLARASLAGTFVLYSSGMAGIVLGSMFSDRFAGHLPRRRLIIAFVATLLSAPFLLVFVSARPGLILLNACIFCFSFLLYFGDCNTTPLLCDLLPNRVRSTAFGFQNAANCVTGGLGVLIAGLLKSRMGLGGVFGGLTVITFLAGLIYLATAFFLNRDLAKRAVAAAAETAET
jgi:MFS family permease